MAKFINICQFSLVLLGLMICGLFLTSLLTLLPVGGGIYMQWAIFVGQNILAFILPAVLAWRICFRQNPIHAIEADVVPSIKMLLFALAVYVIGIPALNQVVYWNQEMHLPETFAPFEEWCRKMESLAEQQTEGLLSTTNVLHTIVNILIIGVLTGIGEEFFFRGALQRMLIRCKVNCQVAIWVSAIVFSALHFQFFGFVPRLLLGVWFGYLYAWSGSIWVNSFAHALNNSLVIVSAWLINKGYLSDNFDMIGVSVDSFPIAASISTIAVAGLIYYYSKIKTQNSKLESDASKNK